MVDRTKAGSLMGAKETKETPSGKSARTSVATCNARRVLPTPPGPVRVSRRTSELRSRAVTAASSCLRPMRGVSGAGSLYLAVCYGPALVTVMQLSRAAPLLTVYVTEGGCTPVESPVRITGLCTPKKDPFQGPTGRIAGGLTGTVTAGSVSLRRGALQGISQLFFVTRCSSRLTTL